jgi:endonuclease-3
LTKILSKPKIKQALDILAEAYPNVECALQFKNNWQLLVAVVLSAQTTDKSVNKITPLLFSNWPMPSDLAAASLDDAREIIKTIGMYNQKAKNIISLATEISEKYDGEVPSDYEALIGLSGVGRKTANVVRSVGFKIPAIAVDTHVFRVSNRIGFCNEDNVLATEKALMQVVPMALWTDTHHRLIWHGRLVCKARRPLCVSCQLNSLCQTVRISGKKKGK